MRWRRPATTALLVTHDQDEALSLADQVAVMRGGHVIQTDAPRDLYRAPVDPEVGAFVGGATVVSAHVADGRATFAFGSAPLAAPAPDGEARVLLRPEQIVMHHQGTGARVEQVHFYGHDAACDCASCLTDPRSSRGSRACDAPAGPARRSASGSPDPLWRSRRSSRLA